MARAAARGLDLTGLPRCTLSELIEVRPQLLIKLRHEDSPQSLREGVPDLARRGSGPMKATGPTDRPPRDGSTRSRALRRRTLSDARSALPTLGEAGFHSGRPMSAGAGNRVGSICRRGRDLLWPTRKRYPVGLFIAAISSNRSQATSSASLNASAPARRRMQQRTRGPAAAAPRPQTRRSPGHPSPN